jgi:FkbM family methyltransferase
MSLRGLLRRIARATPFYFRPNVVTAWSVRWAYRLFLGRNPESKAAVREKLRGPAATIADLRRELVLSGEFAERSPDLAPFALGTVVLKELPNGRRLYVDLGDALIGGRIARGDYENDLVALLPRLVERGTTALDVGANIGFFSIQMADLVGENGRVVAFEPIAEAAALLKRSLAENGLTAVVTVETVAVGAKSGHADILCVHDARNQGASYLVSGEPAECRTAHEIRRIPVVALDDRRFDRRVSFIKLDVEGAEPLCIEGGRALLERDRPIVLSEVHPVQLERVCRVSPNRYLGQLRALNYRCFAVTGLGLRELQPDEPITAVISALCIPAEHPYARELAEGDS